MRLIKADQANATAMEEMVSALKRKQVHLDVVIEDGSHKYKDQQLNLGQFFPLLKRSPVAFMSHRDRGLALFAFARIHVRSGAALQRLHHPSHPPTRRPPTGNAPDPALPSTPTQPRNHTTTPPGPSGCPHGFIRSVESAAVVASWR